MKIVHIDEYGIVVDESKSKYNESDLDDFIECVDDGDIIKFTESGNALIRTL